ncbi:MAG: hypothetical protein M3R53_05370 [Candidatus Eremiobacteraeota bacterium]|nr:hypothetical protein [Candidatus Eremiobacteraeota bacterium]
MNVLRKFRLNLAVLAGASAFALGALVPPVAAGADSIASGTQIQAVLETQDLNTKSAQVGDAFTMNVVRPYPNGDANFSGAVLRGHVASVTSAGQGRKAQLKLAFDSMVFSDGSSQPVSGYVTSMSSKSDNTTAKKGLGAAVGAAIGSQTIGRIIGGSAGSVVGLLGGAAGGFLYANNAKANFNLAKGAQVTMTTNSAVEVPRRQATQ